MNGCLEVSRRSFLNNYYKVKEMVGNKEVMPVIKADAYGTYLNKDIDLLNNFNIVAVALVKEAIELRKLGYKKDIFILNQPSILDINDIIDNDIIVGISSFQFIKELKNINKKIRVHIELETGMGRTGVLFNELNNFVNLIKQNNNIVVEGIYTHLSSADNNYDFTNKQIKLFSDGVNIIKNSFSNIKYIHCEASNGILNFNVSFCNLVRPGLILYGYYSDNTSLDKIKLEPVAKFSGKISFIKEVDEGFSIGYGRSFVSSKKMVVATVNVGYADGVRRCLSNRGFVSLNGNRCKIIGSICMDSFMIDVSDINVNIGDDVYIFDNRLVTLNEIASLSDTINYDVLVTIGRRVDRVFVD